LSADTRKPLYSIPHLSFTTTAFPASESSKGLGFTGWNDNDILSYLFQRPSRSAIAAASRRTRNALLSASSTESAGDVEIPPQEGGSTGGRWRDEWSADVVGAGGGNGARGRGGEGLTLAEPENGLTMPPWPTSQKRPGSPVRAAFRSFFAKHCSLGRLASTRSHRGGESSQGARERRER